ncbi:MAG: hypothetical protein M5R36_01190 [Deltaproteobacteria bacterium]|nr:hypothetical protein [Deltaproteobacteria bacterium]
MSGMWAGLLRLGWVLPPIRPTMVLLHGPFMIGGFLGTVIGVERAVAMGKMWPWAAPVCTAVSVPALLLGAPVWFATLAVTVGSTVLTTTLSVMWKRDGATHTGVMTAGAAVWVAGNFLWLFGKPLFFVAFWWAGFLVLTIAGERLELSRLLRPTQNVKRVFLWAVGVFIAGLIYSTFGFRNGVRVVGLGMALIAVWLLRYDLARKSVRKEGIFRFIALCLLGGYAWLLLGGLMALGHGEHPRRTSIRHHAAYGLSRFCDLDDFRACADHRAGGAQSGAAVLTDFLWPPGSSSRFIARPHRRRHERLDAGPAVGRSGKRRGDLAVHRRYGRNGDQGETIARKSSGPLMLRQQSARSGGGVGVRTVAYSARRRGHFRRARQVPRSTPGRAARKSQGAVPRRDPKRPA